jgi:transcriptional regulator with GAF, ATPase, and Fis domain
VSVIDPIERWSALDLLSSQGELSRHISATLSALALRYDAEHAALWMQRAGVWSVSHSAPAIDHPVDEEELELIDRAAKEGKAELDDPDGSTVAHACSSAGEVVAVLCLHSARNAPPAARQELTPLSMRIGLALKSVQLLEGAGRDHDKIQERLRREAIELRNLLRKREGLLGNDEKMKEVMRAIERTARTNLPILITGETGTGKEAAAKLVHRVSGRSGPIVVVDCGAIPQQLLESELFGYERGAFTGAEGRRIGRFEEAHKGTIFLDEVGELPIMLQPKLLRVLQESTLRRVGGDREIELDIRVIAATNRDLSAMVQQGSFREDLFFRLRVIEVSMPPLRQRGEDVLLLTFYFLRQCCAEVGRELMPLSTDAHEALLAHPWPGNVRELQNRVRRAVVMATGPELTAADLQLVPKPAPQAVDLQSAVRKARPRRTSSISIPPTVAATPIMSISDGGRVSSEASRPSLTDHLARPTVEPPDVGPVSLEEAVADWFWQSWSQSGPDVPPPQDCIEAYLLRAALQSAEGSLRKAASLVHMHPDTFSAHLERLGHPSLSRTVRAHRLARGLDQGLTAISADPEGSESLIDRTLGVVLRELLVYCHGNKSEMARILGWGRRTLWRHFRKLGISSAEPS